MRKNIQTDKEPGTAAATDAATGRDGRPDTGWKGFPNRMRRFCRFLLGLVFTVSGLLKLLDPVGTGLIMDSYYEFFHMGFMDFSARIAGLSLSLLETFAGICLVSGVWRRITAYVTSVMLGFFTVVTLVLVIFNPDMDCGCFGEAIHLTHLQTFVKNLVLCALALVAFLPYRHFGCPKKRKYVAFALAAVAVIIFAVRSVMFIPLVDFTAFRPGVQLMSAKDYGEEAFRAVFIYEKDGRQESFTLDALPDSTWTFVTSETEQIIKADEAPVLSISDAEGEYCDSLLAGDNVMVVSVYEPDRLSQRQWERIGSFLSDADSAGYMSLLLVSSLPEGVHVTGHQPYLADFKTLVSLNRSNGGATYFSSGYLVRKWTASVRPDHEELLEELEQDITETIISSATAGSLTFQGFLLYIFAVMLLL